MFTGGYEGGDESAEQVISESDIIDWLSNKEVITTVMSCTEDTMDALKRYSSRGILLIFIRSLFCNINFQFRILFEYSGLPKV